ncbi:polyketide synthase dehydratase domain-containing protein, partial [Streptomyces sp. NPDC091287]|uniref:polyketide synthase dehydratase domain-containing protein n=1 Tax=Streptomyces sp. NPDC091287 TaxID=3365988 RepID=UPI0037FC3B7D
MDALPHTGTMTAIEATEEEITPHLDDTVSIAAINGPRSIVVSGDNTAKIAAHFAHRKTKQLAVSHAFHSHHMDAMLDDFRTVARTLTYSAPQIPIVSTVAVDSDLTDPEYWVTQVRSAVRFHHAVVELETRGVTTYIELGPDGVLTAQAQQSAEGTFTAALRRGRDETTTTLTALGTAYVHGRPVTVAQGNLVDLPTYAFQHERYWLVPTGGGNATELGLGESGHPLLGGLLRLADGESTVLTGRLSPSSWLADHKVRGTVVVPGTALVDMALHAGELAGHSTLDELVIEAPMLLTEAVQVQVKVIDDAVTIHSRTDNDWTLHATGTLSSTPATPQEFAWPPAGTPLDVDELYVTLTQRGLEYGPVFQGLTHAWRDGEVLYAEVQVPENGFGIHPALLDAALHPAAGTADSLALPFSWNGVTLHTREAGTIRVRLAPDDGNGLSLHAIDENGTPVLTIDRLLTRPVGAELTPPIDGLFEVAWPQITPNTRTTDHTLIEVPTGNIHDVTEHTLTTLQ